MKAVVPCRYDSTGKSCGSCPDNKTCLHVEAPVQKVHRYRLPMLLVILRKRTPNSHRGWRRL